MIVCVLTVAMLQAILFYIPRWLWKNWEAGKIQALKMDLDQGIITWDVLNISKHHYHCNRTRKYFSLTFKILNESKTGREHLLLLGITRLSEMAYEGHKMWRNWLSLFLQDHVYRFFVFLGSQKSGRKRNCYLTICIQTWKITTFGPIDTSSVSS